MHCTANDCGEGCCFCNEPISVMVRGSEEAGYTIQAATLCKSGHALGYDYGDTSLERLQDRLNEGEYTEAA